MKQHELHIGGGVRDAEIISTMPQGETGLQFPGETKLGLLLNDIGTTAAQAGMPAAHAEILSRREGAVLANSDLRLNAYRLISAAGARERTSPAGSASRGPGRRRQND